MCSGMPDRPILSHSHVPVRSQLLTPANIGGCHDRSFWWDPEAQGPRSRLPKLPPCSRIQSLCLWTANYCWVRSSPHQGLWETYPNLRQDPSLMSVENQSVLELPTRLENMLSLENITRDQKRNMNQIFLQNIAPKQWLSDINII